MPAEIRQILGSSPRRTMAAPLPRVAAAIPSAAERRRDPPGASCPGACADDQPRDLALELLVRAADRPGR